MDSEEVEIEEHESEEANKAELFSSPSARLTFPKWARIVGGLVLYLYAVLVSVWSLKLVIDIFEFSWKAGLAIMLTVGFLVFIPPVLAWGAPMYLLDWVEGAVSKPKMWGRAVVGFVGAIALSFFAYAIITLILGFVLAL